MVDKEKERSQQIFNCLINIERKHTSAPQIPAVCAAFTLYLAQSCKGEMDLMKILGENDVSKSIQGYVKLQIGDHWNEYLPFLTVFRDDELADLFATSRWVEQLGSKFGCFTSTPVNRLAIALLDPREGERICDFGCCMGDFLRDVYFYAGGNEKRDEERFVGYEISSDFASIASMRMIVDDIHAHVVQRDFFDVDCLGGHFDKVYCCPPFGVRDLGARIDVQKAVRGAFPDFPEIRRSTSSDWLYAARVASAITGKGKAVVIMTAGAMANQQSEDYRRYFVQRGLIETVIELPERLFDFTGIKTYMIVLSKGNKHVKMLHASSMCEEGKRCNKLSRSNVDAIVKLLKSVDEVANPYGLKNITIVQSDELLADECDLNVNRHFADPIKVKTPTPLSEYVSLKRGAPISSSEMEGLKCDESTGILYVTPNDVRDGVIGEGAQFLKRIPKECINNCAYDGDLLVQRVLTKDAGVNVTVVSLKDGQVVVPNFNLLILTPNDKTDPYYLKAYFDTEYAQRMLQNASGGNILSNLSTNALSKLQVPALPLSQQRKIGLQCRKMVERVIADKKRLAESQAKLASVFMDNASDCFVENKECA